MTTPTVSRCPTCGDQVGHANMPTALIECATRTLLVEALQTMTEEIDGNSTSGHVFVDLLATLERRCDGDIFRASRCAEAIIGLGWRPGAIR